LVNGTDEMYCVFLGRAVGTVNAPAGSVGTSQLAADSVTNAKIADDAISDEQLDPTVITGQTAETSIATDDLILLSDTSASGALKKMTRANFVSGVGGTTAPYVAVYRNGDQNISDATHTKIQFNVEVVDSAGAFDSSTNYRYTPQTSGYYFISANLGIGNTADNSIDKVILSVYKNGSSAPGAVATRDWDANAEGLNYNDQINTSTIVQMNGSSDYIEAFAYIDVTSGTPRVESGQASMQIFKMTE